MRAFECTVERTKREKKRKNRDLTEKSLLKFQRKSQPDHEFVSCVSKRILKEEAYETKRERERGE